MEVHYYLESLEQYGVVLMAAGKCTGCTMDEAKHFTSIMHISERATQIFSFRQQRQRGQTEK